jgi:hypothetical protein
MSQTSDKQLYLKVIACEIAFREICHTAAQSRNILDLEFLTQGHHDTPCNGRAEVQARIDAVLPGKYNAIVIGYGLCSNILAGLTTRHTPLVIPRAHDCITFFLGSKQRYQEMFETNPGTYYYTSGWLECRQRRGSAMPMVGDVFMPARSHAGVSATFAQWVERYGEEKARYLMEVVDEWTAHYTRGTLIDFTFTTPLKLGERVKQICQDRGWEYTQVEGDLTLFQHLLDGIWDPEEVLVVQPNQQVVATFDRAIIGAQPV